VPASKRPRRAPTDPQRRRDPERTRERIPEAAVGEFGERGYSGARVSRIAASAGVNAQLISYYFDGKAGLYQALVSRWRGVTSAITQPGRPMDEIAAGFVRAGSRNRSFARLLAWESLGDVPAPGEHPEVDEQEQRQADFLRRNVEDLRQRQAAGEFAADLDPGHLLLALFAMASAPTMLPQIVRRILDTDPDSPEFREAYAEQVARLVRHLMH
jgi:TetR/AcrR family transcriptional regulator